MFPVLLIRLPLQEQFHRSFSSVESPACYWPSRLWKLASTVFWSSRHPSISLPLHGLPVSVVTCGIGVGESTKNWIQFTVYSMRGIYDFKYTSRHHNADDGLLYSVPFYGLLAIAISFSFRQKTAGCRTAADNSFNTIALHGAARRPSGAVKWLFTYLSHLPLPVVPGWYHDSADPKTVFIKWCSEINDFLGNFRDDTSVWRGFACCCKQYRPELAQGCGPIQFWEHL